MTKKKGRYFLNAISSLPGSIYWKSKKGVYLGANDEAARMAGVPSVEDLIGKTDHDLFTKKQADQFRVNDLKVMQTGHEYSAEEISYLPNGKEIIQLSTKKPLLDEKNNIVGIVGITTDITHQKESQILKVEQEKLKRQLETMETLSATIAHELRTPLAAICLAAEGCKDYFPILLSCYQIAKEKELTNEYIQKSHLDILAKSFDSIIDEVKKSQAVIRMMLFNVEQLQNMGHNFKIVSIVHCLNEALQRYPFKGDEKELIHLNNKEGFNFKGDADLTIHILFNLIKNAIYYVRAANKGDVNIWLEKSNHYNKLYFKDTGKGIAADILPNIFKLFFTKTYHGTGVGLAYCKMVMENYGGKLECNSVEGEFTEFVLSFPVVEDE